VSFILEALRKSESERQRLGNAAMADLPVARRAPGQPWWMFGIGALLLINLGVLAAVLLRGNSSEESNGQSSASTASAPQAVAATANQAPTNPAAPNVLAEEATPLPQVEYETVPRSELELANAAASVPDGPTLVRPANSADNSQTPDVARADADADMHVDLHVYAKNARERFVMINMHRYTEGQQLPNGARVEQITPEGVVLYRDGRRYQLNRQ